VEFSVHDPDSGLRERERVLGSVRRGLRTLTNASGFAALIPNVGANVAECLDDARTIDDVAAVPGRLVDVKGRAMVPGEPEFGVSEHVATVLLAAREAGATARGAVNVRYAPDTVAALAESHPTVEFDAERPTDEAVADAVAAADLPAGEGSETLVLYQTGAVGVEPIVYVLAPTAADAARVVRDLL
jgi:predicted fused transcriptional regulator/phosphomethylpyrimidine kinase